MSTLKIINDNMHKITIALTIDGEFKGDVSFFYQDSDWHIKDLVAEACEQAAYTFITYILPENDEEQTEKEEEQK